MIRIWMNHWFSTAYEIINLIRRQRDEFFIVGSNRNEFSPIRQACDEWHVEPDLQGDDYVEYCLDFCRERHIDLFIPRRGMQAVSRQRERFERQGTRVMTESYPAMKVLGNKELAYERIGRMKLCRLPEYHIVSTTAEFLSCYRDMAKRYERVCFKFVQDEGGQSFHVIDDAPVTYHSLFYHHSTHIRLSEVVEALSRHDAFASMMMMPFLAGDEVSVDCLRTKHGNIMVPRIKNYSRVERIAYDEDILAACSRIITAFSLKYPCDIQFKYLDGIPYFLEVNTRMSGGIQMSCLATGINIPQIAVDKMLGRDAAWKLLKQPRRVAYVEHPVIVAEE